MRKAYLVLAIGALALTSCAQSEGDAATAASATSSVELPEMVGLPADEADAMAEELGIEVSYTADKSYDEVELDQFEVTGQSPQAGSMPELPSEIELTVAPVEGSTYAALADGQVWVITCSDGSYMEEAEENFSSMQEVWASDHFNDFTECSAENLLGDDWKPSKAERKVIALANVHWDGKEEDHYAFATALELCSLPPTDESWSSTPLPWLKAASVLCPKAKHGSLLAEWAAGKRFGDGNYEVGSDIPAGTYVSEKNVDSCYWERTTPNGGTIANDFITHASAGARVTVRTGETLTVDESCGNWHKQ